MSEPSAGALRAADAVTRGYPADDDDIDDIARIIDRETGLPDLLEAAEALVNCNLDHPGGGCEHYEDLVAAIAKARGEA